MEKGTCILRVERQVPYFVSLHKSRKHSTQCVPVGNVTTVPTIAFWNLARKRHLALLSEFIESNGVEILVVAEQNFAAQDLIESYRERTGRELYAVSAIPSRVRFYSVFPERSFRMLADDFHLSFREYRPSEGLPILLAGVHLPSKWQADDYDQIEDARDAVTRIAEMENIVGHDRTLVLGDFNMNPFDPGMVHGGGMHGVMDRQIAQRNSRNLNHRARKFFYNPMWKLMGDHSAPAPGTFYRDRGEARSYFWHTLDQVLLRPSLLAAFREDELHIVSAIGTTPLLIEGGTGIDPTVSDHLPILLKLNIQT